jgi:putative endonuclease
MTVPRPQRSFYTYILTNNSGTLYVGITSSLESRIVQHRNAGPETFAGRYEIGRLVYYEENSDVRQAIAREKQIKGWTRQRKFELIASLNPIWRDLGEDWGLPPWPKEGVSGEGWILRSAQNDKPTGLPPCLAGGLAKPRFANIRT